MCILDKYFFIESMNEKTQSKVYKQYHMNSLGKNIKFSDQGVFLVFLRNTGQRTTIQHVFRILGINDPIMI